MDTNYQIGVIGNGAMGCAVASVLESKNLNSLVWGNNKERVLQCQKTKENKTYLPNIQLPDSMDFTNDKNFLENEFEIVLMAVPTQHIRETLSQFKKPKKGTIVVSLSKGLELNTCQRPTEIIQEIWPEVDLCSLSGPAHAEEVANKKPATVVISSTKEKTLIKAQELLNCKTFRVYRVTDPIGVELGGALKNIIAIAAGISDGLEYGDNSKSALITRGCAEMTRLGVAMGAQKETFSGLAGIGDLITTCISPFGRNYSLGKKIGQGQKLSKIMESTQKVSEGVWTVQSIPSTMEKYGVEMPISQEVYNVLFNDKNPKEGVKDLMNRAIKAEF